MSSPLRVWLSAGLLAAVLSFAAFAGGCAAGSSADESLGEVGGSSATDESGEAGGERVLEQLPGYPHDAVPLYEVKLLDTVYYSVRNDPQWAIVEGGLRNFYHSVWESNVPAADVLAYYRDLCDEIDEDSTFGEQLTGRIGVYDIFLNTGFHNDKNMAYLSVDLPRSTATEVNPFFEDYPKGLVELDGSFAVYEEQHYQTLFGINDVFYTRQFDIVDANGDGRPDYEGDARLTYFEERYGDRTNFVLDSVYGSARWTDGEYNVVVAFSGDGSRGALTIGYDLAD
ncbi:MAG: hypothetical protein U1E29_07475 [Coriobacteriia bacterium]|nr:hypothetical protein [Coriobacteriia bacterium]